MLRVKDRSFMNPLHSQKSFNAQSLVQGINSDQWVVFDNRSKSFHCVEGSIHKKLTKSAFFKVELPAVMMQLTNTDKYSLREKEDIFRALERHIIRTSQVKTGGSFPQDKKVNTLAMKHLPTIRICELHFKASRIIHAVEKQDYSEISTASRELVERMDTLLAGNSFFLSQEKFTLLSKLKENISLLLQEYSKGKSSLKMNKQLDEYVNGFVKCLHTPL